MQLSTIDVDYTAKSVTFSAKICLRNSGRIRGWGVLRRKIYPIAVYTVELTSFDNAEVSIEVGEVESFITRVSSIGASVHIAGTGSKIVVYGVQVKATAKFVGEDAWEEVSWLAFSWLRHKKHVVANDSDAANT